MTPRLSMLAWTQRQGVGADPYGGGGTWADHLSAVACYWWVGSGAEKIGGQHTVTIAGEHVLLPRDVDVREGDRVRRVVDHRGRVVVDSADASGLVREVEHVATEREHLHATLKSTR